MIKHRLPGVGVLNHVVSLLEFSLLEERIGLELEDDLKADASDHGVILLVVLLDALKLAELLGGYLGAGELSAPDVNKVAQSLLVGIAESGDLTDSVVVVESVVPEVGDTGNLLLDGLLGLLGLEPGRLLLSGLGLARGDLRTAVVDRVVELLVLLDQSVELLLELGLEVAVLLMKTLEGVETKVHLGGELLEMLLLVKVEGGLHVTEIDLVAVAIVAAAVLLVLRHFLCVNKEVLLFLNSESKIKYNKDKI